jgi:hypothetical protein
VRTERDRNLTDAERAHEPEEHGAIPSRAGADKDVPSETEEQQRDVTTGAPPQATGTTERDVTADAMAKTAAFLGTVRLAIQAPLAALPRLSDAPTGPTPTPRRSGRLASQPPSAVPVRPSKKGEILAMKKLGIISRDDEAELANVRDFDKFLVSAMQPRHFAALRDIFPAANALPNAELRLITNQVTATATVC